MSDMTDITIDMMNENYELTLGPCGTLSWFPEWDKRLMFNIGQVEEEYVDVVQDVLKELKRLREKNKKLHSRCMHLENLLEEWQGAYE